MRYTFESLCNELLDEAQQSRQRRFLVLSGEPEWGRLQAEIVLRLMQGRQPLMQSVWVAEQGVGLENEQVIPGHKHQLLLGREYHALVFDAYSGLSADALGAASGVVAGGGLMVLLTPDLAQWQRFADPEYKRLAVWPTTEARMSGNFLQWMVRCISSSDDLVLLEEGAMLPERRPLQVPERLVSVAPDTFGDCLTRDQQMAVDAIRQVASGHRRRPLVITADRGRGKSSALGIAAASLIREGKQRILVTAPNLKATEALFKQAGRLLEGSEIARGRVSLGKASIEFIAPDELIKRQPVCDLLLVDEAAAIPAPLLETLLGRYARIVYASTIHGYEGSGRGFTLRFQSVLQQRTPHWRQLTLNSPIRWAVGDPLERWCFSTLLLDAECPLQDDAISSVGGERAGLRFDWLEQRNLLEQPQRLSQIFGLLVMAHYRTSPADLRHLLDGPNLRIVALMCREQLVGVALLAEEGGFDAELSQQSWLGSRRPRGHLLPQSLAAHAGLMDAPQRRCLRVMRIAVHPGLQGQRYGSSLLDEVERYAGDQGFDCLGASFGATLTVLKFWHQAGFLPVRLGISREASSGSYSAMVMKGISSAGHGLQRVARARFVQHFPDQLAEVYPLLESPLVNYLLDDSEYVSSTGSLVDGIIRGTDRLSQQDWLDLISFADGHRVYETCMPVLQAALIEWIRNGELQGIEPMEQGLLVGKILQHRAWRELAQELSVPGQKQLVKQLREIYARQLDRLLPEELREFRAALR